MSWLLPAKPPPMRVGVLVAVAVIGLETLLVKLLQIASPQTPPKAIVYMLGVLVITSVWGAPLGIAAALLSTVAFNYFFVPPAGLNLTAGQDLDQIVIFAVVALFASGLASVARASAEDARRRAAEAEISAQLAHIFLRNDLGGGLREASRYLTDRLRLSSASLELAAEPAGANADANTDVTAGGFVIGIGEESRPIARLRLAADTPPATCRRIRNRLRAPLELILRTALDREHLVSSLRGSQAKTEALLTEQTALRRVATLVATGGPPANVFTAVTAELHHLFAGFRTALVRYQPHGEVHVLSERDEHGALLPARPDQPVSSESIVATIAKTAHTVQVDYDAVSGPTAEQMRQIGVHRGVGVPIVVDRQLWGVALVLSHEPVAVPADAEARLLAFTELVATAIANAESRAALAASRSRLVTAADEARRRIERDLHDGAQQRIISLALQLRLAEGAVRDPDEARHLLAETVHGLTEIHQSLSDLARGIHPAMLVQGGIGPILRTLARRSVVPVELDLRVDRRLPEPVEIGVYYVVSEALTNIAKHARASLACVSVAADHQRVRVNVHDDGVGAANPKAGTGLVGLRDRVEALGGHLNVVSPPGQGTTLHAEIPLARPDAESSPRAPGDASPAAESVAAGHPV
ncbi:sensor histidine kinase [Dactylosporangium sp. CA-139114]|uniref:sensor histidine kinase n=1 Tax=Dactylosporangium sp. CA-139114 TaxID=3239931 RepID=UPI003D9667B2